VRQGAIEASNVSTGVEMVDMMAAIRRAESGQRLVNVYDDLMGRALTLFGQVQ
jgi:flagellar basal body rod protein FlgG